MLKIIKLQLLLSAFLAICFSASAQSLLIQNVNVIDVTGGDTQTNRSVLISDGRIERIVDTARFEIPENVVALDATGKYLIPGLWDMHVHAYDYEYLPLFIVNGITGTRQMWGNEIHYEWRERENTQEHIGPKTIVASDIIDGNPKNWPFSIEVTDESEARELVRHYQEKGADFIKVYDKLSRDVYLAIADESKKVGLPIAGHVPLSMSYEDVSDAGQKSIEHLLNIGIATSDTYADIVAENNGDEMDIEARLGFQERLFAGHRGERQSKLFEKFVQNDTWVTPTLTVHKFLMYPDQMMREYSNSGALTYMPVDYVETHSIMAENFELAKTSNSQQLINTQFQFYLNVVGDMHRAGVKLIAGTDGTAFCFPGCTVHDELALFVEAGLTPMAALQTATLNAAEFLDKLDDFGTVEEGKVADLVLLEADPLSDIENTSRIGAVILNGILYEEPALDEMLTTVRNLPINYDPNYGTIE